MVWLCGGKECIMVELGEILTIGVLVLAGTCVLAVFLSVLADAVKLAVSLSATIDTLRDIRAKCVEVEYIAAYDLSNDIVAEVDYRLSQINKKERD
jgi:hypothetical protein